MEVCPACPGNPEKGTGGDPGEVQGDGVPSIAQMWFCLNWVLTEDRVKKGEEGQGGFQGRAVCTESQGHETKCCPESRVAGGKDAGGGGVSERARAPGALEMSAVTDS